MTFNTAAIIVLVAIFICGTTVDYFTAQTAQTCINSGAEWIDGDCVREGER